MANKIFISYRWSDNPAYAGWLFDHLTARYGAGSVFRDVDQIEPGSDFVDVLNERLAEAGIVLVVIGPAWLVAQDAQGQRRLDDPLDFVRLEIATALKQKKLVVPVLVDSATMPPENQLPDDLKPLVRKQAVKISHEQFENTAVPLYKIIEKSTGLKPAKGGPGGRSRLIELMLSRVFIGLTVVAATAVAASIFSSSLVAFYNQHFLFFAILGAIALFVLFLVGAASGG